jgi:transposase
MAKFARVEVKAVPARPAPVMPKPESPASTAIPVSHPGGMIEIALPCGVSVRVDAQVDGGALRRVLGALARR